MRRPAGLRGAGPRRDPRSPARAGRGSRVARPARCLAREALGLLEIASLREQLRLDAPPGDLRVEVVVDRPLLDPLDQCRGLVAPPLLESDIGEAAATVTKWPRLPIRSSESQATRRTRRRRPAGRPAARSPGFGLGARRLNLEAELLRERQPRRRNSRATSKFPPIASNRPRILMHRHLEPAVALDLAAHLLAALQADGTGMGPCIEAIRT